MVQRCGVLLGLLGLHAAFAADFALSPAEFQAGEPVVVTMAFTAPDGGLPAGGKLRLPFYLKPWNGLPKGLADENRTNELVTATRSDGGAVSVVNILHGPQFPILSDLELVLGQPGLTVGATLTVTFGTEARPVSAMRKQQRLVVEAMWLAPDGKELVRLIPPPVRVNAAEPQKLFVAGPSQVQAGQPAKVVIWAEDRFKNVVETLEGPSTLTWPGGSTNVQLRPWDRDADLDRIEVPLTFNAPGVVQVTARYGALEGKSNAIEVVDRLPERRLYWGDIHVHTQISDGRGELADAYREAYARGHDFLAITDHGFGRGDRGSMQARLHAVCDEAERFQRAGSFITIPAGETHYIPQMHMNLYFVGPELTQMVDLTDRLGELKLKGFGPKVTPEERAESARRYWAAFDGFGKYPLAFPHHTMWTGNQEYTHATRQRLIEVISTHGSSETRSQDDIVASMRMKSDRMKGSADIKYAAREQLDRGFRLGFAGGSDNHEGQPGQPALTGLYAAELSREAILDALWSRRCFATSGERTVVDLTAAAAVQGQELDTPLRQLRCRVLAEREIERLDLVSGGAVVYSKPGEGQSQLDLSWGPAEPLTGYVYARAMLAGSGGAWSSPIWFGN